jgi:hypothetical protein
VQETQEQYQSHLVEEQPSYGWTGTSYQFDLSFQEEQGYESDDTLASEDTAPTLLPHVGDYLSDSDSEEEDPMPHGSSFQTAKRTMQESPKVPMVLVNVTKIGSVKQAKALIGMMDSGGSNCLINERALPKGTLQTIRTKSNFTTTAGVLQSNSTVDIDKLALPEFTRALHIKDVKAYVFNNPDVEYDIIFGRDFLSRAGITLNFQEETINWMDFTVPMKAPHYWSSGAIKAALATDVNLLL